MIEVVSESLLLKKKKKQASPLEIEIIINWS